jgi:hypothetical protein
VLLEYGQAHLYTMALLHKTDEDKKKKQSKGLRIRVRCFFSCSSRI